MSTFASTFTPMAALEAQKAIESKEKIVLFVGRPSCPYCQRFEPKLRTVAQANNLHVNYLNSEDQSQLAEIQAFRAKYDIPTVPGLLVAEKGEVRVVCDSSLSEAAILAFIN